MILKVENNKIYIYGYIYDGSGIEFLNAFSKVDGNYPVIDVYIHNYGGSVFDGNMIFNALLTAKSQINTNDIGVAASMGAILLQAGTIRRQVSNGFQMLHAPSGYTSGTAKDHKSSANLLTEMEKQFVRLLVAKTGKSEEEVIKYLDGDNWYSADQALSDGLIDEIIDPIAQLESIENPNEYAPQDLYNRYAAAFGIKDNIPTKENNTTTTPQTNNSIIEMKQDLIQKFELAGVTANSSDTAVITALENYFSEKLGDLQTKLAASEKAKGNLETAINAQKKAKIDALLAGNKFTPEQKAAYENIGNNSGIDALEMVLAGLNQRKPIAASIGGGKTNITARDGWNWDDYQEKDPKALETMQKEDSEAFGELFKAKYGIDFNN